MYQLKAQSRHLFPIQKLYIHIIFHIKINNGVDIRNEDLGELFAYITKIIELNHCRSICVGGTSNHVHILCTLSRNETVSHLVEKIKRNSSRWLGQKADYYRSFNWQGGYAVFSVSQSVVDRTKGRNFE